MSLLSGISGGGTKSTPPPPEEKTTVEDTTTTSDSSDSTSTQTNSTPPPPPPSETSSSNDSGSGSSDNSTSGSEPTTSTSGSESTTSTSGADSTNGSSGAGSDVNVVLSDNNQNQIAESPTYTKQDVLTSTDRRVQAKRAEASVDRGASTPRPEVSSVNTTDRRDRPAGADIQQSTQSTATQVEPVQIDTKSISEASANRITNFNADTLKSAEQVNQTIQASILSTATKIEPIEIKKIEPIQIKEFQQIEPKTAIEIPEKKEAPTVKTDKAEEAKEKPSKLDIYTQIEASNSSTAADTQSSSFASTGQQVSVRT